jgi:hypothetical protein
MKQILDVRSNAYYTQPENAKEFELKAFLEIVIIHTDGKDYKLKGGKLETTPNLVESRFVCSPEQLTELIGDLQMHQKKMESIRQNAEKLTGLVKYIDESSNTTEQ